MARRIANDELARFGTEIAVSHINGDTLFALCAQSVGEQRQIGDASALYSRQVVLQHGFGVDE